MSMNLIFAIDAQVFIYIYIYIYMKCKKIDLCTCEAISYMHGTTKTAFVGVAININ